MQCPELFNALVSNDFLYLQQLIMETPGLDINAPVIGSMSALHIAAEKGYSTCVQVLISYGAEVDVTDDFGYTPLMNSVAAGYPLVVSKLMKQHSNCNKAAKDGTTALHMAARLGSAGLVQLLIAADAKPTVWNSNGETPLSIAIANCATEVAQVLLLGCHYVNANSLAKTYLSPSPLFYSLETRHFALSRAIVLAGYHGNVELQQFKKNLPKDVRQNLSSNGRECLESLLEHCYFPSKLQHVCRLAIRQHLKYNIWEKAKRLNLPSKMVDYVCFREIYVPLNFSSEYDVSSFFAENTESY